MSVDARLINRTTKKSKKRRKLAKMLTEDVNKNVLTLHQDMSARAWTVIDLTMMDIVAMISMSAKLIHFRVQEKFEQEM